MVTELLARGHPVIATGRNGTIGARLAAMGARFCPSDLARDDLTGLLDGVAHVFHLAALSAPYGREADFVATNVLATRRLLDAARAAGCASFVFTSTPSIYARPQDQIGITETTSLPPKLANAYARTKLAAEQAVLDAHGTAMACIALRPRAILSPFDTALLPRLLRAADKGVMPLPHDGRALLEPTDARDVVSALLAAQARAVDAGGRAYNISGGVAVSLRDLVTHLFGLLGKEVRLQPVPRCLLLAMGTVMERLAATMRLPEPPLTAYGALILGYSQTFDLSSARQSMDWAPRHHPFDSMAWVLSERLSCDKS